MRTGAPRVLVPQLPQGLLPSELFKPTALELPDHLTYEQWDAIGSLLGHMDRAVAFWWGDFCLYGETHYGEAWASARALADRQYDTNKHWVSVARMFAEKGRRRPNLSWAHHREVARFKLPEHTVAKEKGAAGWQPDMALQDKWLDLAEQHQWSVRQLREEIAKARGRRPWDLDEALERLVAAVHAIADRWPEGARARKALGERLCALGEEVLAGGDLGA